MTPSEENSFKKRYWLENQKPFGQSLLWKLQRQYYSSKGVDAWRKGEIPFYPTSNPFIANSYAALVFALLRDQDRLAAGSSARIEPIHICELGAGSGKFAFHFLQRLLRFCAQGRVDPALFRYVLTDQAEDNLRYWREHPRFQPFFESGLLDIAHFEVGETSEISLRVSGRVIAAGDLQRPLVVIANYLFDSVPQDLFLVNDKGFHRCLVSLILDEDPNKLTSAEILDKLDIRYGYDPLTEEPYEEPWLRQIFDSYRGALKETHLIFPAEGLRCLRRLKALSQSGVMLLSADKGSHRLGSLEARAIPGVARHKSFSICVNYHAIKMHVEQSGGLALFPDAYHRTINVSCSLMLPEASEHREVRQAYERHVAEFGPDDFVIVACHTEGNLSRLTPQEMMAYLRLGHYDSNLFVGCLQRLIELVPDFNPDLRDSYLEAIRRVWDNYFPLGGSDDLAFGIGCLLYKMGEHELARGYFERSIADFGEDTGALVNLALCLQHLNEWKRARAAIEKILAVEPGNEAALGLMETCVAHEQEQKPGSADGSKAVEVTANGPE